MASKNKQVIERSHAVNKTYSYKKGNVTLDFTLNLGVKSHLKDFIDLLTQAIIEVEADLKQLG